MTEQENQELIEMALRLKNARNLYGSDIDDVKEICEIALASLTAQPVKLPPESDVRMGGDAKTRSLLTGMNMMRKSCAEAIRAAGYEVEE